MPDELPVSKSQRKREAAAMFELAGRLVEMTPAELDSLSLEPALVELVKKVRGITRFVARKRELMFLAKQLRREDRSELLAELAAAEQPQQTERAQLHRLEGWRDYLLAGGRAAINELSSHQASIDRPKLSSLVKKALLERERQQPPASARLLFRALREIDQQTPLPAPPTVSLDPAGSEESER
ncbi:MAG: ribosome biogenesis factor YjgA [Pseudomonadota bacterium]